VQSLSEAVQERNPPYSPHRLLIIIIIITITAASLLLTVVPILATSLAVIDGLAGGEEVSG